MHYNGSPTDGHQSDFQIRNGHLVAHPNIVHKLLYIIKDGAEEEVDEEEEGGGAEET
jgi:hypothetical protein